MIGNVLTFMKKETDQTAFDYGVSVQEFKFSSPSSDSFPCP